MRRTRELPSSTDMTFNNNQTKKPQSQLILNLASLKPRAFHSKKEVSKASLNFTFLWALSESAKGISFERDIQNRSFFPDFFLGKRVTKVCSQQELLVKNLTFFYCSFFCWQEQRERLCKFVYSNHISEGQHSYQRWKHLLQLIKEKELKELFPINLW